MSYPRPIETRYKNYRFRSRLEARWAVFFDTLGYTWEYEKEGFDLGGVWYLPDFWLQDIACYAEVKATQFSEQEIFKARQCACILLDGMPEVRWYLHAKEVQYFNARRFYHQIHLPKSLQKGRPWYRYDEPISTYDNTGFYHAVAAARGARFEHGEQGSPFPAVSSRQVSAYEQSEKPALTLQAQNDADVSSRLRDLILREGRNTYHIDFSRNILAMSRINDNIQAAMKELRGFSPNDLDKGVRILLPFLSVSTKGVIHFEFFITLAMIAGISR